MVKELIFSITKKDFEITYFNGSGAGGQHRNKHKNCVRIKHIETGLMATGQSERSLEQNKKQAFTRLVKSDAFQKWLKIKINREAYSKQEYELELKKIVDDAMKEENLKIEYY